MSSEDEDPPTIVDDKKTSSGLKFLVEMDKNTSVWMSLETAYAFDINMVHEYIQKNVKLMKYPEIAKRINGR